MQQELRICLRVRTDVHIDTPMFKYWLLQVQFGLNVAFIPQSELPL